MKATTRISTPLVALVLAGALGLSLAGCTGGSGNSGKTSVAEGTPTTSKATAAPVTSVSSPAASTPESSVSSVSPPAGPSSEASSPESSSAGTSAAVALSSCSSASLQASLATGGGSGAGTALPYLVLKNTGASSCTVRGYPGVSFVGSQNGTQLGAAGLQVDESAVQTVTLAVGQAAHSQLRISRGENYPADKCSPAQADGFRVYPPDEVQALFVAASGFTACTSDSVSLIMVGPMEPGEG